MAQANGRLADSGLRIEGAAYQNELERLTRLIWDLEEPIESSGRCIRELKSRYWSGRTGYGAMQWL